MGRRYHQNRLSVSLRKATIGTSNVLALPQARPSHMARSQLYHLPIRCGRTATQAGVLSELLLSRPKYGTLDSCCLLAPLRIEACIEYRARTTNFELDTGQKFPAWRHAGYINLMPIRLVTCAYLHTCRVYALCNRYELRTVTCLSL